MPEDDLSGWKQDLEQMRLFEELRRHGLPEEAERAVERIRHDGLAYVARCLESSTSHSPSSIAF